MTTTTFTLRDGDTDSVIYEGIQIADAIQTAIDHAYQRVEVAVATHTTVTGGPIGTTAYINFWAHNDVPSDHPTGEKWWVESIDHTDDATDESGARKILSRAIERTLRRISDVGEGHVAAKIAAGTYGEPV